MNKEDITHKVTGCAYQVYNNLGFGFLESVYRKAMAIEIESSGLRVVSREATDNYPVNPVKQVF